MSRRPPRIVHTFIKYPPAIGGQEIYVAHLVEGLRDQGFDARVVTSNLRAHLGDGELLDAPYDHVNGVPVTRLETERPLTGRVVMPRLRETLLALRPDLIHAHDLSRDSTLVSLRVARELDIPVFVNPVFHDHPDKPPSEQKLERFRSVAAEIPPNAHVFFNTRFEPDRLAARGVPLGDAAIDYLPPSIDFEEFAAIPEHPVEGIPRDRLLVSFVGRLEPDKGLDQLIPAFSRALKILEQEQDPLASRAHLVIAGFRDSGRDYAPMLREHGIANRATILVDRPRAEIINLLRASHVFAFPSRSETFGIVVTEAWATRNDVLVSEHTALPYVVEDGVDATVVCDGDWPARLVDVIRAHGTPAAAERIRRGLEKVTRDHDRRASIRHLRECVEHALGSGGGRGDGSRPAEDSGA